MLNKLISLKNQRAGKRLGRGTGSGKGSTAGRGTKGQKSRSGYNIPRRFEGGQTPLIARLPKAKGFTSRSAKPAILNISMIEKNFKDGEIVSFKTLVEKKLVIDISSGVKILGPGKLTKNLKFHDVKLTKSLLEESRSLKLKPVEKRTKVSAKKAIIKKSKKT